MGVTLITCGTAMSGASSLLFTVRLAQLTQFLKTSCPAIWNVLGPQLEGVNYLARYQRLRTLPLEYESDNALVNQKLTTLAWIYKSTAAGLVVVLAGVLIELIGAFTVP